MRLWSIHPKYLDSKGLVAAWREALLAQAVLLGNTRGYRNHPQLERFRATPNPVGAIASYLRGLHQEAENRGYHFDSGRIARRRITRKLSVSDGQLAFEMAHLRHKLEQRDPERLQALPTRGLADVHPLFELISGEIAPWERP